MLLLPPLGLGPSKLGPLEVDAEMEFGLQDQHLWKEEAGGRIGQCRPAQASARQAGSLVAHTANRSCSAFGRHDQVFITWHPTFWRSGWLCWSGSFQLKWSLRDLTTLALSDHTPHSWAVAFLDRGYGWHVFRSTMTLLWAFYCRSYNFEFCWLRCLSSH